MAPKVDVLQEASGAAGALKSSRSSHRGSDSRLSERKLSEWWRRYDQQEKGHLTYE
ncbi:unnamed protein product, partial [Prorocentrum cordatum]